MPTDLGFSFHPTNGGEVAIRRGGRIVTILRGVAAREFLSRIGPLDPARGQQLMARVTGNYRRGNERKAVNHSRNRRQA